MKRVFRRALAAALITALLLTAIPFSAQAAVAGDVNEDNAVNMVDVTTLYTFISGGEASLSPNGVLAADLDGNYAINMYDLTTLYRIVSGQESGGEEETKVAPSTAVRSGVTSESVYMNKIVVNNTCTGKTFTGKTKANLQMAVAEIVRYEIGMSTFGEKSDEAWKAMAVCAYTLLARHCYNGASYDIYMTKDIDLNNATDKRIYDAVGEVLGIKLAYNDTSKSAYNQICQMYYSASSAGTSCTTLNVWGYTDFEYLQPVESLYDNDEWIEYCSAGTDQLTHTFTISMDELKTCLQQWLEVDTIYSESKTGAYALYATKQDGPYWAYSNLYYYNSDNQKKYVSGINIYNAINRYHPTIHCYSHALTVTAASGNNLTITTKGNGHGIGLSQYGAAGYANEAGWDYNQILTHYFSITDSTGWGLVGPKW